MSDIRRRYADDDLKRKLEEIGRVGHADMPPQLISRGDLQDLVAYLAAGSR